MNNNIILGVGWRRVVTRRRSHVILLVREHGHRKDGVAYRDVSKAWAGRGSFAQGKFMFALYMETGKPT